MPVPTGVIQGFGNGRVARQRGVDSAHSAVLGATGGGRRVFGGSRRQKIYDLDGWRPKVGPSTRQFNSAKRILAYDFGSRLTAFRILSGRGVTIRVAADTMKCGGRFG